MISHSRPYLPFDAIQAEVEGVLQSGYLANGPLCRAVESLVCQEFFFPDQTPPASAHAVQSGTAALHLALEVLKTTRGGQAYPTPPCVLTSTLTCASVVHAIRAAGCTPVLLDTDKAGMFDIDSCLEQRHLNVLAVIVPHLYGFPLNVKPLNEFFSVVEDCAQTMGVSVGDKPVGSRGCLTVTSFYATKLFCCGQGGLIASRDNAMVDKARAICRVDKSDSTEQAWNYDLADWNAAVLLPQLRRHRTMQHRRATIAQQYLEQFEKFQPALELPSQPLDGQHGWFRFVINVPHNSDRWIGKLNAAGIECKRPVYQCLHQIFGLSGEFPHAEHHWQTSLSIPIYPALSDAEVESVSEAIQSVADQLL